MADTHQHAAGSMECFAALDIRVGRVLSVQPLPNARTPAYAMTIDLGPEFGVKHSSAQLTAGYPDPSALVGRLVLCVVNLPVRRVAGFKSEVLTLGVYRSDGRGVPSSSVSLLVPDPCVPCKPGDRLG